MIIHLDLDCFFASCERVQNPQLNNRPIAVGGRSDENIFDKNLKNRKPFMKNSGAFVPTIFANQEEQNFRNYFVDVHANKEKIRGIVTTASYEARAHGVKTAMSIQEALRLCPSLLVIPPNHMLYHEFSHKIREFLQACIPIIEQFSIDEFFGDLRGWVKEEEVESFCHNLRLEIYERFKLPISIGAAKSKWIAKLATEFAKPFGSRIIFDTQSFTKDIKIEAFAGIGKAYQKKLKQFGLYTLGDIQANKKALYSFKRAGRDLYHRVCGDDNEPLTPTRERKSIGISRTFDAVSNRHELLRRVLILARHVCFIILKLKQNPTTFYFKIKYETGQKSTKSVTHNRIFNEPFFMNLIKELFLELDVYKLASVTAISISGSNFIQSKPKTLDLLHFEQDSHNQRLSHSLHHAREKYGVDIIRLAKEIQ